MNRTRKWIAMTVVIVVLLIAGGWYLLVSPKNSATAARRTQTATANGTSATLQGQLTALRKQQAGLSAQERLLKEFNTRMPPVVDLPSLIRDISGAARTSKADLVALAPGIVTQPSAAPGVAPPGTVAQAPAATPAPRPSAAAVPGGSSVPASGGTAAYSIVPISITISGSYFVVESFLAAVEALPRALVVSSLTVTPGADPASSASPAVSATSPNLLVAMTATAYVAPSGASVAAVSVSPAPGVAGSLK